MRPHIVSCSGPRRFPAETTLVVQGVRFGLPAGPVGVLPCPVRHGWIVNPRTWVLSSAVKRCSVWPQRRLYAAEVALKLRLPYFNRRIFSGALRQSRERTGWGLG